MRKYFKATGLEYPYTYQMEPTQPLLGPQSCSLAPGHLSSLLAVAMGISTVVVTSSSCLEEQVSPGDNSPLCPRQCLGDFLSYYELILITNLWLNTIFILILHMRKPRLREVKSLAQGYPESLWSISSSKGKASHRQNI